MHVKKFFVAVALCFMISAGWLTQAQAASSAILGWNNLGMHCMDSDYSVFSILPPYNTIEAQLIVGGKLMTTGSGYTLTYEAIADPDGSINTTSIGKGNWGLFASILYGAPSPYGADTGLAGWNMPGAANTPQAMRFETANSPAAGVSTPVNWFRAEGIPLTPIDDKGVKNSYPLMHLVARDATNTIIATSDIVLPVSDEMDCSACHLSGSQTAAQPAAGWVFASSKDRDYRLNILKLHDEKQFADNAALYRDALAAKGYDATGLYTTANNGKPILCAGCHASEALGLPSFSSANGTVPQLTTSMHTEHSTVMDPQLNVTLNDAGNRNACYRCHPGSATRCLRGAMGSSVAPDGTMAMQCQSCHGTMSQVGSPTRTGWFMEPACQSCHTGTATKNSGQILYTSAFDANGQPRVAADQTFATTPNTPAAGLSLYRFSVGHGGLQCSACHGSTHAEFPSSGRNDNIRNIQLQGHVGMVAECTSCHATMPTSPNGGPHGMHPIGQSWVSGHESQVSALGRAWCQTCHGTDYRGTVLSRVQGSRTFSAGGTQTFYRGATIGCYTCHQGPGDDSWNTAAAPVVGDVSAQGVAGQPVTIPLSVTGTGAVLRIVSQPVNGTVGLSNNTATYYPAAGFTGTDTFTFAAYDGAKNSRLATATVTVTPGAPLVTQNPLSQSVVAGSPVTFSVTATGVPTLSYQWYKNGSPISGATSASFAIAAAGLADAGSYYVAVANGDGSAVSTTATLTVTSPAPAITGFTPTSAAAGGAVAITGANFTGASRVAFNGTAASFTVVSATQISAVVPAGATSGAISVTTPGGSAVSGTSFTVLSQASRIVSFTPTYGGVGTAVTLTGSGFTGASSVTFNGVSAPFTVVSDTTVVCGVPKGATSGAIRVTTGSGTATSSTSFSVGTRSVSPKIQSFSPTSGPAGTAVTVVGTNLGAITSAKIGGVTARFQVLSASKVVVTVPSGAASGRISVTSAGGTGSSSSYFTVK
ncbi:Ig-like domain-containing protein [Geomonas sp. Red32]|uniref:IPT/TIG domain-containing protein n=1 Tax=Geomonas sp. Red32 TaxID=2912856 RepID=UPI00202CFCBD|nr:IPT/TIG domain-containing protein [Geomonas sp. Red32]MCM0082620.1 Ig-like domain-containing protein [Geomonas sp. Red32]